MHRHAGILLGATWGFVLLTGGELLSAESRIVTGESCVGGKDRTCLEIEATDAGVPSPSGSHGRARYRQTFFGVTDFDVTMRLDCAYAEELVDPVTGAGGHRWWISGFDDDGNRYTIRVDDLEVAGAAAATADRWGVGQFVGASAPPCNADAELVQEADGFRTLTVDDSPALLTGTAEIEDEDVPRETLTIFASDEPGPAGYVIFSHRVGLTVLPPVELEIQCARHGRAVDPETGLETAVWWLAAGDPQPYFTYFIRVIDREDPEPDAVSIQSEPGAGPCLAGGGEARVVSGGPGYRTLETQALGF